MSILDEIVEYKRGYLAERMAEFPLGEWETRARSMHRSRPALDFAGALRRRGARSGVRLIAEVKKASPSAGDIADKADPVAQAQSYAAGGAHAISVLTDRKFFKGHEDYLPLIRAALPRTPLLRKEFIIDPYQVFEARALGADAILLIAAILEREELRELLRLANALDMQALVEVYEDEELEKIRDLPVRVLGVNNRDLKTMKVSLEHTAEVLRILPSELREQLVFVSESGIRTMFDVEYLRGLGVDALLVGETLMRAGDPAALIAAFTADAKENTSD